jgi:hypothetical protein
MVTNFFLNRIAIAEKEKEQGTMLKTVETFGSNVLKTDGQESLAATKMIETHVAKQKTNFKSDMMKLNKESAVYSKTLTKEKELEEKNGYLKKEIDDHLRSVRDMVTDINGSLPKYVKNVHGWMQDNQKQLEPNHNKRFLRRTKRLVGVMRARIAAIDGEIGVGAPGATSTVKGKAKKTVKGKAKKTVKGKAKKTVKGKAKKTVKGKAKKTVKGKAKSGGKKKLAQSGLNLLIKSGKAQRVAIF